MQVHTHLFMSHIIRRTIEKKTNIKLDRLGFMYGNIKPDVNYDYYINSQGERVKVNHFKDDALPFLLNKIDEVLASPLNNMERCSKEFSIKLGTLTHYFSDFFCYAHTEHFTGNIYRHHLYETQLATYHNNHSRHLHRHDFTSDLSVQYSRETIIKDFEEMQRTYMDSEHSCMLDIHYAIQFCSSLGTSIIMSCLQEDLQVVA